MKKRLIVFLALVVMFCNVFTTRILATGEDNNNEPEQQQNTGNGEESGNNQQQNNDPPAGDTDSVILIANGLSHGCMFNDNKNRYEWIVEVNSFDSPVDVVFSRNTKYKKWTVASIESTEISVAHPTDVEGTGNKKVSLELNHDYMYTVTGTLENDSVVTQKHYIRVEPSTDIIGSSILVSRIERVQGISADIDLVDYSNLQNNVFGNVKFNIIVSDGFSALVSAINTLQQQDNYETANYKDLNLEEGLFTFIFKEGVVLVDKKYRFETNPEGSFPKISYILKVGETDVTETVNVVIWPKGDGGGPQNENIIIEGNTYMKRVTEYQGQSYTAYVSQNFSGNVFDIFNNLNFACDRILVKYNFNPNPENVDIVYDDGTFLMTREKYSVEVYLPNQTQAIEEGAKLSDLTKVTEPFSHYVTYMMQRREAPYSELQNSYKHYLMEGMGYYDAKNILCYVNNIFTNEEEFNAYHDGESALLLKLTKQENGNGLLTMQLKTKAKSFALLNYYQNGNNIQTATQGGVEEFASGGNAARRLEQRIEALNNTYGSTIKLTENITLTENAVLAAFLLGGVESDTDTRHLTIDLNGHELNVGENELHIPQSCAVRIINSSESETPAKITGSGETVIKNYNLLYIEGNILISNSNGTAVTVINDQRRTTIKDNVTLSGKIGLLWTTRPRGAYNMNAISIVNFSGNINKATEYGIKYDIPKDFCPTTYRFSIERSDWANKNTLTSDGIGLFANGDAIFRIYNYNLTAKEPFVVNGGTYDLNGMNVTATDGSIFKVDSTSQGATDVNISINLEGEQPETDYIATGHIVAETSSEDNSKIKSVNMTSSSDSIVWFDYAGGLFANVPSNTININSGMYIDKDYENYMDSSVLSQYTIERPSHNGKTYYRLVKPNNSVTVTCYDELYNALVVNKNTNIFVDKSFDCSGRDPIEFEVDSGTIINMKSHTIENIKLIANAKRYTETATDCELKINNGSIINSNDRRLDAIVLNGTKLRLNNVTIESNGNAVLMHNGGIDLNQGSTLKGRNALRVNIDKTQSYYFGSINSQGESRFIGVDSEAIYLENTYNTEGRMYIIVHLVDTEVSVVPDSNNHLNPEVSAIRLDDVAHVSMTNSSIDGGKFGVYLSDSVNGPKESEVKLEGANITAENGINLSSNSRAYMVNGTITANGDAICAYANSQIWIYDGFVSVGEGSGDKVVEYKDSLPTRRNQKVVGGYYSKEVDEINLGVDDPQYRFNYVCLQVNPLSDPYPYAIVRQYNAQVRVFQSISNSIHRDPIADQQLLENAISDKEKEYLEESSGAAVDIVFTITPETSAANINKMPKNLRGVEYYDIHINKNVGQNKKEVEEVTRYQLITMSLNEITGSSESNNYDPAKVVVYHRHGNGNAKVMKKVSEEDGKKLQEECYYITNVNGNYYINLVTKRFSTFAIGDQENDVATSDLKPHYTLTLNYETEYVEGSSAPNITTATYNGTSEISVSEINVVYEGTEDTKYYSTDFPTSIGTYKAIWTVKEDSTIGITGSGEAKFTIVSSHVHKMTHYSSKPATCTTEGNIEYWYCSDCQKSFSDENGGSEVTDTTIGKLDHTLSHHDKVDETCTTSGNKEYWQCDTCRGYFLTEEATEAVDYNNDIFLAALNHNTEHHNAASETCTSGGNKEYWYCLNCKKYFLTEDLSEALEEEDVLIAKLGHDMTHVTANSETCEEPGNYEYWYCKRCKEFFADENGDEKFVGERIIPQLGHIDDNDDGICDRESCKKVLRIIVQEYTNETVKDFVTDNLNNGTAQITVKNEDGNVVQITDEDPIVSMEVIISNVSMDELSEDEKNKVEQITNRTDSDGNQIINFVVDIKIKITTEYENEYTLTEFKSETNQPIPIKVQLPPNMIPTDNQVIKVYTIHNGVLKEVGIVKDIDENGKGILYASEFSTYIFALEAKPAPAPAPDSGGNKHYSLPKTGV